MERDALALAVEQALDEVAIGEVEAMTPSMLRAAVPEATGVSDGQASNLLSRYCRRRAASERQSMCEALRVAATALWPDAEVVDGIDHILIRKQAASTGGLTGAE